MKNRRQERKGDDIERGDGNEEWKTKERKRDDVGRGERN
jgi:hypothetical protein